MTEKITIVQPDEITKIVDVIHDCWFDIDTICYDKNSSELSIKFEKEIPEKRTSCGRKFFFKRSLVPIVESFLKIFFVKKYELKDDEQVGMYDFNTIEYNKEKKIIRIVTGIPLGFYVDIDKFKIAVVITDKVIKSKQSFSII